MSYFVLYQQSPVLSVLPTDLLLIDQQNVGKRSLHLMATVNVKKRWTTIYWRVNEFLKKSHIVTRFDKERASFLKINDIINLFFGTPDVSGNANSLVLPIHNVYQSKLVLLVFQFPFFV
jgi:hypothetical protein